MKKLFLLTFLFLLLPLVSSSVYENTVSNVTINFTTQEYYTQVALYDDGSIYFQDLKSDPSDLENITFNATDESNFYFEGFPITISQNLDDVLVISHFTNPLSNFSISFLINTECEKIESIGILSSSGNQNSVLSYSCNNYLVTLPQQSIPIENGTNTFYYGLRGSSGGGGGSSDDYVDNSQGGGINLNSVKILSDKLCTNSYNNPFTFATLDINNSLINPDSIKIYMNNTLINPKIALTPSKEFYEATIINLSKGTYEFKVSASQKGKEINETKILEVKNCLELSTLVESNLDKLSKLLSENENIVIVSSISLIFVIAVLMLFKKGRKNE